MATPINQFRNRVSRHVPGCPLPVIDSAVREAAIRFCEDTLILSKAFEIREVVYTSINSGDNDSISINIYDWDDSGSVIVDGGGGVTFDDDYASYDPILLSELHIDQQKYSIQFKEFQNDVTDLKESGFKFFNFPSRYVVKIFPLDEFADAAVNFDVFLRIAVKPTLIATVIEDTLYYDHSEAITAGALATLHSLPERSWTNLDQAGIEERRYNYQMGKSRIRIKKGYTDAGSVISGGYF